MMMGCGHVICKESLQKLCRGSSKYVFMFAVEQLLHLHVLSVTPYLTQLSLYLLFIVFDSSVHIALRNQWPRRPRMFSSRSRAQFIYAIDFSFSHLKMKGSKFHQSLS